MSASFSLATPDLDDVFLSLTGDHDHSEGGPPMTAYPLVLADSATMLRRNLRRMRRYPSLTLFIAGIPVVLLLLFVYVFGGTLGAGLGGGAGGRDAYLAYVVPGILLITVAGAAQGTAISVAMDMTEGIIARFRTMAIARVSVLTGHVVGSVIQTMLAIVIVMVVAVLIGFRSTTGPSSGSRRPACSRSSALAISWLSVALGMSAEQRRDREQPADVPGPPALPEQRLRPDRVDAGRPGLVRRAPALHARSSRPCAACCWGPRSATAASSASPGAS